MNTALISLASNTPDKQHHMEQAISELQGMKLLGDISSIYETAPYGNSQHPNYLNAVARINSTVEYEALHDIFKKLEQAHGRTPESKLSGEITLDIDIVVWNDEILRPRDFNREYFQTGLKELRQPVAKTIRPA